MTPGEGPLSFFVVLKRKLNRMKFPVCNKDSANDFTEKT